MTVFSASYSNYNVLRKCLDHFEIKYNTGEELADIITNNKNDYKSIYNYLINLSDQYCIGPAFSLNYSIINKNIINSKFVFIDQTPRMWRRYIINNNIDDFSLLGCSQNDPEKLIYSLYDNHQKICKRYFKDKDNFLNMNLKKENPWIDFCNFLDLPIPTIEFPYD